MHTSFHDTAVKVANNGDIQAVLNSVIMHDTARGSINYAKARIAIESSLPNRETKRRAKLIVLDHLGGVKRTGLVVDHVSLPDFVQFPDHSRAKF